jgi:1-acyl-sn-glycerol-3-phosphate acyltransferase
VKTAGSLQKNSFLPGQAFPGTARSAQVEGVRSVRYAPPVIWPWLLRGFLAYAPGYVRKHFHSVRITGAHHLDEARNCPLVIYMNHASWWDPMMAALLAGEYLQGRAHYTPIDAEALEKYKFFSKIGFFGVERGRISGARKLLEIGSQILRREESVLWITPQGRFADVRQRPVKLASGLANLLLRTPECAVIPVAVEYVYWEERMPEALLLIGEAVRIDRTTSALEINAHLEARLEMAMDELARASIRREVGGFTSLLAGTAGVGGFYDRWRALVALLHGQPFDPAHGKELKATTGSKL